MACRHFAYEAQSLIGTFVAPTKAIPVISGGAGGTQREMIESRVTGSCRALYQRWLGAKPVAGNFITEFWDENIASILKTILTDTATTGSDPYEHGMVPNDTADLGMLSAQFIHTSTLAVSVLALFISSIEIAIASKETAKLTFNWEARDKVRSGAAAPNWDSLGTSAPAIVDTSAMYPSAVTRPLAFYDGAITRGGTLAYTDASNQIAVTGGTTVGKVRAATITLDQGLDTDGFEITNDPTRLEFPPGNRAITGSMDISWSDKSYTIYDLANLGTAMALQIDLLKTATLGVSIILPQIKFDPFALPDVQGDETNQVYAAPFVAENAVISGGDGIETDINVIVYNGEATI